MVTKFFEPKAFSDWGQRPFLHDIADRPRPRFARKEPLRGPHAGRESLTNLLGAAWTPSESRMHVPRCDVATTSPVPPPRRLPTAGSGGAPGAVEPPRDRSVVPSE